MPIPIQLQPGHVYRTRDLAIWGANPTRLAQRLVQEGRLHRLAQGLYHAPKESRFGPVPPEDREILRAFLGDEDFVFTGPLYWNALGLGATAAFPAQLVYNRHRSGEFQLGGSSYWLRRVRFPEQPFLEWYLIDLLEHHKMVGQSLSELEAALVVALKQGRFDTFRLEQTSRVYATKKIQDLVDRALQSASI